MNGNDPFAGLPNAPWFTLTSADAADGESFAPPQLSGILGVDGGGDVSPQLSWGGAPDTTQSFAVTMYDPDAPTGSGFWHWALVDIPAGVNELAAGAGDGSQLPAGAFHLRNDGGAARYIGAAPPAGDGVHRYFIVVHALDVSTIGVGPDASPALLGFTMLTHTVGRAVIVPTFEIAA